MKQVLIDEKEYIDFKVYSVTRIKNKYGFRVVLIYEDKKRVIQKSGFKTKKQANELRNTVITKLHNGTFIVNNNLKLKDFIIYWLEEYMRPNVLKANSYDSYKSIVYNHIIPVLGNIKMCALSRGDIEKLYNEKIKYSKDILIHCKAVLSSAIKYALKKRLVDKNVVKYVRLPKSIKKKKYKMREIDTKRTLNEEQIKVLIEKSKDTPIHMQILFATLMGLRKQEINGLKYSDVDYIHRTLTVQRQLGILPNINKSDFKYGEYTKQEISVKTFSSNRVLQIPDIVFDAILEERKKYEKNRNRRINDKTTPFKDLGYICCSTYGRPRSKSFHFKYRKQLLKDCNLPDMRFHDLRATYCTLLLKNNISPKAVSKVMGHASEIISVDVYGDNSEIIADALKELEPIIEKVRPKEKDNNQILEGIDDKIIDKLRPI